MRHSTLVEVTQLILEACTNLRPEIIRHGFLKCSISNTLDGTEADIL